MLNIGRLIERWVWFYRWHRRFIWGAALFLGIYALFVCLSLSFPLFEQPLSYVVYDRAGNLVGAKVAEDGQWRFPQSDTIPDKFKKALIAFEDKRFYYHPGVDFFALGRALYQNISRGRIVSGGSTLTMQIIRLSRKHERSLVEKIREIGLAFFLEMRFSKDELLQLYASNAPFGGNVVGLEAACWRYLGRPLSDITWAEAAMLAVLPNNPGLIHPGRNRLALLKKRNELLDRLVALGCMDASELQASKDEPLPEKPLPMPALAPHLTDRIYLNHPPGKYYTTLDASLQNACMRLLEKYATSFKAGDIHNAAILVLDIETGGALVYVGNLPTADSTTRQSAVDMIRARRSPGSTLKPLLYAALLSEGKILPQTLVPDIPIQMGGFAPQNFNKTFDGAVPASEAIARSLNVPAVNMLQMYGVEKFYQYLKDLGFQSIDKPASFYGLALILGGCEVSMWELSGAYASLARMLNHFGLYNGKYDPDDLHSPAYLLARATSKNKPHKCVAHFIPDAGSVWHMLNAMEEVQRPGEEAVWKQLNLRDKLAWKTGTSYGYRDAWAIGMNTRYLVCVWVGNATGEGRPGIIGLQAAAPIMLDVFQMLPPSQWFQPPYDAMSRVVICRQSGYKASSVCPDTISIWVPSAGKQSGQCPYHHLIHTDLEYKYQATANCLPPENLRHEPWFILPPALEYYYRRNHPEYRPLPPPMPGCGVQEHLSPMQLIYPGRDAVVYLPRLPQGEKGEIVAEVAHRRPGAIIYWHLDGSFYGFTTEVHKLAFKPSVGVHTLLLLDDQGNSLECSFSVMDKVP